MNLHLKKKIWPIRIQVLILTQYTKLKLICNLIHKPNSASDMMHMEENKIVINSIDGASGDNMTIKVTKRNPHIKDHQNVLEARNLDGVFSKQED